MSNQRDDGGNAFPMPGDCAMKYGGMTLRDYFAAKAMSGWAASGELKIEMKEGGPFGNIAGWCYAVADAMLAERSKS